MLPKIHLKTFILNNTGAEELKNTTFLNHTIEEIVLENNHHLTSFEVTSFSGIINIRNITIRRNNHLKWTHCGYSLLKTFEDANTLAVIDLEANNITFKGDDSYYKIAIFYHL